MATTDLTQMNEVVLSSTNNILTSQMVSAKNTIYVVKNVFDLNGAKVDVAENCILDFRGGALKNGKLNGLGTVIKAPEYQIFDNRSSSKLELLGTFRNDSLSVHWFGAKGDGTTDDAHAINYALSNSRNITIAMAKLNYLINSTIFINSDGLSLKCNGTIFTNNDITIIDISSHYNNIDINELKYNLLMDTDENPNDYMGIGVLLSWNVYHCNINVNSINYVKKGFAFIPVIRPQYYSYAGSQYNKFTFQVIRAMHCIYINLLSGNNKGYNLWMNENQFFGGRVRGQYGIYVERPSYNDPQFDWINGNVFNCIGFEDIETPVYMYHASMNDFNDVRMSESIYGNIYIDLLDCNNLIFNTKSFLRYSVVKAEKCCQIQLSRLFSDAGLAMGFDRMALTHSRFPTTSQMKTDGVDLEYIYREDNPLNILRKHYFGWNVLPSVPMNFNDFFAKTWDGMMIFSNLCEITMYDDVNLYIEFKDSIYNLRPDMTLRYDRHGTGKIYFYMNYPSDAENDIPPIAVLDKRGTYKITTDRDYKIHIIPIAIDPV